MEYFWSDRDWHWHWKVHADSVDICSGPVALHPNSAALQRYFVITCDFQAKVLYPAPVDEMVAALPKGAFNATVAAAIAWRWRSLDLLSGYSLTSESTVIAMGDAFILAVNTTSYLVWSESSGFRDLDVGGDGTSIETPQLPLHWCSSCSVFLCRTGRSAAGPVRKCVRAELIQKTSYPACQQPRGNSILYAFVCLSVGFLGLF